MYIAAGDRLDRLHDPAGRHHGVRRLMRHGTMAATAIDLDGEGIHRRHDRTRRGVERAQIRTRHVVDAVNLRDIEAVHHPFGAHHLRAAAVFFGGLENQRDTPRKIPRLRKIFRRPQQGGGVPVMAAGVHLARMGRGIVNTCLFHDRQRVEIRTQAHSAPCASAVNNCHDARLRDAGVDLVHAELLQPLLDERRGLGAVKAQLGDGMQMLAPGGHIGGKIRNAVEDGHGWTPVSCCPYLTPQRGDPQWQVT